MTAFGYARTSTTTQQASLEHQQQVILASGVAVENLVVEELSAVAARPALEGLLKSMRDGDALVVTTLSRLARSTKHLLEISETLHNKGCSLQILDFSLNTATAQGKMVLTMLAAVAEMERTLMLERQAVGVAKAKAEGKYKGRPALAESVTERVLELKATTTLKAEEIAKLTELGVSTVYKILAKAK